MQGRVSYVKTKLVKYTAKRQLHNKIKITKVQKQFNFITEEHSESENFFHNR